MTHDPYDYSRQEAEADEKAEQLRLAHLADIAELRSVLSTRRGRNLIFRMLERTGVFRLSYTGDENTFFREGERNVGLWLLNLVMEAGPAHFTAMMQEQQQDGRDDTSGA
jgi:hypothetical protein